MSNAMFCRSRNGSLGERSGENCDVWDIVRTFRACSAVLRGSKFRVTAWGYSMVLQRSAIAWANNKEYLRLCQ